MPDSAPDPAPRRDKRDKSAEIKAQRDRFVAFSFAAAELVLEVDKAGRIAFASGAVGDMTGKSPERIAGTDWLEIFSPHDRRLAKQLVDGLAGGARCGPVALTLAHEGERGTQVVFGACRLPGGEDRLYCTLSYARSASMQEAMDNRRDAETGLVDTDSFGRAAGQALDIADKLGQEMQLTLMEMEGMADLSGRLEDGASEEMMHQMGDFLRLNAADGNCAGRLGEDRFGVVHDASIPAEQLSSGLTEITRERDPAGEGARVTSHEVDLAATELSEKERRQALVYTINKFAASQGGAFDVDSLNVGFRELIADTVRSMQEMKNTVAAKKFDLAFQPIVALPSGKAHHYEVLSRLEEGKSPFEWIGFAENVGMIESFDLAVCQRVIDWLTTGEGRDSACGVAVNLSGQSLASRVFVDSLLGLLDAREGLHERLMFEITESAQITDLENANATIQAFRQRGFRMCLDDFGAGAASFQYLHGLDIDFVKIDGAYIKDVLTSQRDAVMLKAIAQLCRDLGVQTIAERLEAPEQVEKMVELGMDFGQGFLYGKPAASPEPPDGPASLASAQTGWDRDRDRAPPPKRPPRVGRLARRQGVRESWG